MAGWLTIVGALAFFATVLALHMLEPGVDPQRQLMSELAHGHYGWLMGIAFAEIAISILAAQYGLVSIRAPVGPRALLIVAALSLFGAGVFRLGDASQVHIALVVLASVSLVLAMYLLARLPGMLVSRSFVTFSFASSAAAAVSVALGCSVVPVGLGQRAATLCVLVWLGVLGRTIVGVESVERRANTA